MNLRSTWGVLKEAVNEFSQDRVLRLAAATAYYAVFSIGPLLVLIVGLAGLIFGQAHVQKELHQQVQSFVGQKSADLIGSMMSGQHGGGGLLATIVGGVGLVLGASGVFGQLQDSLNTIWGVTTKPGASIGALIRDRFFSLATVLGTGFLLIVSMALSAFVNSFAQYLGRLISQPAWIVPLANAGVSFIVISLLFALIFKLLPDVRIRWRDVWMGAIGTAVLFTVGKFLLSFYLKREASPSAYGAGSALVVILLYVYYSSVILYFGAEFTRAYAVRLGSGVRPSKYAVQMTDAQRAEQGIARQQHVEQVARRAAGEPRAPHGSGKPAPQEQRTPEPALAQTVEAKPAAQGLISPGERVQARPWAFVGVALSAGLAAGWLWRVIGLSRALKIRRALKILAPLGARSAEGAKPLN